MTCTPGRIAALLLIVLLGCPPPDDTFGDGGESGETGDEPGVPIPMDPFGGEGSDPPGDPDTTLDWPQPLTLGNGLVHDSRYDLQAGEFSETFTAAQLVAGVDWADFVDSHALKLRNGFRPTQVDAEITMTTNVDETIELAVVDRSVYVSDDDANYKTQIKTFLFGNVAQEASLNASGGGGSGQPRPTSIDTFALPGGRVGATVAFVYDNNPIEWKLVVGQNLGAFQAMITVLAGQGYRPISISSRRRKGSSEYAGIFVQDWLDANDWHVSLAQGVADLAAAVPLQWKAGFYPFSGGYEQGSWKWPRFNVLWIRRSPGLKLELRFNLNDIAFEAEDQHWRSRGYHLEGACAYRDAGLPRYAGLWVRHEPYMRWQDGVAVDETSPSYAARYQPFHQQALQAMTLAGNPAEGEYFRPSATLHIFEGDKLVLNRAYTYAGAIYPDTPLDAHFALASVSKSITAAAVVLLLWQKGISLNASFAATVGIKLVAMAQVMIVDVLRNLGGFNEGARSYLNHSIIDASPYGKLPITGPMMYDYVVQGGHLDKYKGIDEDGDSYWNLSTYKAAQQLNNPKFTYSNLGFSMLGELIRILSGQLYEDYVRKNLLVPLGLEDQIYPDPGHRNAADAPTQSGLRSYLINESHPYNPFGCADDTDCNYLVCVPNDPNNQNCVEPVCGPNQTCVGCSANSKSCRGGWACINDECIHLGVVTPLLESEPVPVPNWKGDGSPGWFPNTGPIDPTSPTRAAEFRYAGKAYMGGAPLAAGGWHGNGQSLAVLIRALAQSGFLMPKSTAAQLWSPAWLNSNQDRAANWYYGLGWYVRGNWIAMAGGSPGSMSLVLHNRAYDFTVVYLTNVKGNVFEEFLNPLLGTTVWSPVGVPCPGNCSPSPKPQSVLGGPFPCIDDNVTQQNECQGFVGAY